MKSICLFTICCFITCVCFSQDNNVVLDSTESLDKRYKEDQFYFAVTYNLMANKPSDVSQTGFSSGFHLGFIKDMPINKRRNLAIGLGLGLARSSFNHNLLINKDESSTYTFEKLNNLDNVSYTKNRLINYLVEVPLEFRWRSSTADSYKFWRIYSGIKLGYSLYNAAKYKGSLGKITVDNIDGFNKFQYGATLGFGYNTWNFHIYYALTPLFEKQARVNGNTIDINEIRIGLIFYIL
ncbi:porin family protein [Mangrovimonas cancribranchiae]|uniref:Porin family protein n=1 Tax=Mangrovimonas cancribranchiae TaxID=3080055 RepID=A0AAU6P6S8_9FLAO